MRRKSVILNWERMDVDKAEMEMLQYLQKRSEELTFPTENREEMF